MRSGFRTLFVRATSSLGQERFAACLQFGRLFSVVQRTGKPQGRMRFQILVVGVSLDPFHQRTGGVLDAYLNLMCAKMIKSTNLYVQAWRCEGIGTIEEPRGGPSTCPGRKGSQSASIILHQHFVLSIWWCCPALTRGYGATVGHLEMSVARRTLSCNPNPVASRFGTRCSVSRTESKHMIPRTVSRWTYEQCAKLAGAPPWIQARPALRPLLLQSCHSVTNCCCYADL